MAPDFDGAVISSAAAIFAPGMRGRTFKCRWQIVPVPMMAIPIFS